MCGRITRTSSHHDLAAEFGVAHFVSLDFTPRYNIAPSQTVEAIIRADGELRLGSMRWGLTSVRPKAVNVTLINSRDEVDFADKLVSALRFEFGEKAAAKKGSVG